MHSILPFFPSIFYAFQANESKNFNSNYFYKFVGPFNTQLEKEIKPLLKEKNITCDIAIREVVNPCVCAAFGTNMSEKNPALILIPPEFHKTDEKACQFLTKHEIGHIKNNDCFTIPLVTCICSAAAAIFGAFTLPWVASTFLAGVVSAVALTLFTLWREGKADDFAIENSTNEELLGGRRMFIASKQANLSERTTFWKKIAFTSDGEDRFDIMHPSLNSRVKKIEKELAKRRFSIDQVRETERIDILKQFMIDFIKKVSQSK